MKVILKFLKGYFKSLFFIMWYCYWGTRSMCMIKNVNPKLSRKPTSLEFKKKSSKIDRN